MQRYFLICEKENLKLIGIFGNSEAAKDDLPEGDYVFIPVWSEKLYSKLIALETPGAVEYIKQGTAHDITSLQAEITGLKSQLTVKNTEIAALDNRIKIIEITETEKEIIP